MTKHEPATALPWITNRGDRVITAADFRGVAHTSHVLNARNDAAYIAHAANAYPKLVEALQGMRQFASKVNDQATAKAMDRVLDVLREIGEAS